MGFGVWGSVFGGEGLRIIGFRGLGFMVWGLGIED